MTKIITGELLDALKYYDPTKDEHQFKQTSSSFQINKPAYLDGMLFCHRYILILHMNLLILVIFHLELSTFHLLLANVNKPLKALIDWSCLVKQMNLKVHALKKHSK